MLKRKSFFTSKPAGQKGDGKQKEMIDDIISKYLFLASERLKPYLVKVYGAGFYTITKEESEIMLNYLEDDYKKLRNYYYGKI